MISAREMGASRRPGGHFDSSPFKTVQQFEICGTCVNINMELTASKSAELVDGAANWQPIILSVHTG
jgi:hypothetical protein